MGFPPKVKEKAMVACARRCCICHKFCGVNMEVHHIKARADGGADTFDNAIPLCFDCHANVRQYDPRHPKGTKYTEKELIQHRDNWYAKVKSSTIEKNRMGSEKKATKPAKKEKDEDPQYLIKIDTGRQLLDILVGAFAISFDNDEPSTQEEADFLAGCLQECQDIMDVSVEIEGADCIALGFTLNDLVETLDQKGFWIFACRTDSTGRMKNGKVWNNFPTAHIRIIRKDNENIIKVNLGEKNETSI